MAVIFHNIVRYKIETRCRQLVFGGKMKVMEAAMAASERQFARSSVRVWIGINIDTISQKCLDKPFRLAIGARVSIAGHDAVRRLQVVDTWLTNSVAA